MSAEDNPSPETIATLRIDLLDSDPPIWREVEVPTAITLKQLHTIVQAAMEWEDAHLWEFTIGREPISASRAARVTLQDLLRPRVTRLLYTYDMGDCWEHQLTLTKPRPAHPAVAYPRYIAGENPAPPEDCGGIPGFYAQLEALADPHHPDHEDAKQWFGDFDPNRFDEQPIKDRLARIANRRRKAPQNQIAVISGRLRIMRARRISRALSCPFKIENRLKLEPQRRPRHEVLPCEGPAAVHEP